MLNMCRDEVSEETLCVGRRSGQLGDFVVFKGFPRVSAVTALAAHIVRPSFGQNQITQPPLDDRLRLQTDTGLVDVPITASFVSLQEKIIGNEFLANDKG